MDNVTCPGAHRTMAEQIMSLQLGHQNQKNEWKKSFQIKQKEMFKKKMEEMKQWKISFKVNLNYIYFYAPLPPKYFVLFQGCLVFAITKQKKKKFFKWNMSLWNKMSFEKG